MVHPSQRGGSLRQPAFHALLSTGAAVCILGGTLLAHGGQFRGPWRPGAGQTPGVTGPSTPVPGGLSPGHVVPLTGASASFDPSRWQLWWELNKEPFLRRRAVGTGDAPGTALSEPMVRDAVLPALRQALESTANRDIATACTIALGKAGLDHPGFDLLPVIQKRLQRGDQEIREAAVLALGIARRREAIPALRGLLLDQGIGRRLVNRDHVGDRTRAFAAFALGLIAERHDDFEVDEVVFATLRDILESDENDRDILVATIHGIRMLGIRPGSRAKSRRLYWQALEALHAFGQNERRAPDLVRAHVPAAIASLIGRTASTDATRFKRVFLRALHDSKSDQLVEQSAALALGVMCLPKETHPDDEIYSEALVQAHVEASNVQTRYFSLIAMGQIGGTTNRDRLLRIFRQSRGQTRAWCAIALGVLTHGLPPGTPETRETTQAVGRTLAKAIQQVSNRDERSAMAVALGLSRHEPAAALLRGMLKKYRRAEDLGGYLCIGLALLDDTSATRLIEDVLVDGKLKPILVTQASLALARLGATDATETLSRMLARERQWSLAVAGIASALGHIGDPASAGPLSELLLDEGKPKILRAFAGVALGLMSEPGTLPWNASVAANINYHARTETLSDGMTGVLDIL